MADMSHESRAPIPEPTKLLPEETISLALLAMDVVMGWPGDRMLFVGDDDDPAAWFEVLIHEVSHAVEVGLGPLPFDGEFCRAVSDAIPEERSIEAEARALATEWFVWQALGLTWEREVLYDFASIQNVEDEDLDRAMEDPSSAGRVPAVLDYLRAGLGCLS